jgi:hypothetical protein
MYKLKENQESFQVVDGEFAGRSYKRGETYSEVPPNEAYRFDEIPDAPDNTTRGKKATPKNSASAGEEVKS